MEESGGIERYDEKLEKYLFIPIKNLSKSKEKIYFTEIYGFQVNIYDTKKKITKFLRFSYDKEKQLHEIFKKSFITERDRELVKKIVNRFNTIYSTENLVLLFGCNKKNRISRYWLINFEKKRIYLFSDISEGMWSLLAFVRGNYKHGFISFIDNKGILSLYKKETRTKNIFESIDYGEDENPLLILFDFKK